MSQGRILEQILSKAMNRKKLNILNDKVEYSKFYSI